MKNYYRRISVIISIIFILTINTLRLQATEPEPDIQIHYLGHSSFVIQFDNGVSILTDYGTSNCYGRPSPIYSIMTLVPDIVTYSHNHPDHYGPEIPAEVSYVLSGMDTLSLNGIEITPIRTSETNINTKSNTSFLFEYKGFKLVHLGDAQANIMNIDNEDNRNNMKEIFPDDIDLLLMTIEGVSKFIPAAESFIDLLKPKRVIPMHYWTVEYKFLFLSHLETFNTDNQLKYQIEKYRIPKYFTSTSETDVSPIKVISLEPGPFSECQGAYLWLNSINLDDSQHNNNSRADAGETVNLVVEMVNSGVNASNISMNLSSDDSDVQIVNRNSCLGNLDRNARNSNENEPFIFSVTQNSVAHYSTFYLDITADEGYASVDSFEIIIGTPTVLLIDDDGGQTYEEFYTEIMIPEIWDTSIKECPSLDLLQAHESVIWFTGDEIENTLNTEEQNLISSFLDNGGKLLLSGQNIGCDLLKNGSEADSIFFTDYLHAEFIADSSNSTTLIGEVNDPIANGMFITITNNNFITAPDALNPIAPAQRILKYIPAMSAAGIRYKDETTKGGVVYFSFGIETINGPNANTAEDLIRKSFEWLAAPTTRINNGSKSVQLKTYKLEQNYPNPFNPTTTIRYSIPENEFISLKIYNIMGKEIITLVSEKQNAGSYNILFDGSNLASGVYLFQMQAGSFLETKKLLLVK